LDESLVLKVARHAPGAAANRVESDAWNLIVKAQVEELERRFVPVLRTGPHGAFLVVSRVTPLRSLVRSGKMLEKDAWALVVSTESFLASVGWECPKLNTRNVGLNKNGDAVILDYGHGVSRH
jgi:hypothetical protein